VSTYRLSYGWQASHNIYTPTFAEALRIARHVIAAEKFGDGFELPTLVNTALEDECEDGLTAAQRSEFANVLLEAEREGVADRVSREDEAAELESHLRIGD